MREKGRLGSKKELIQRERVQSAFKNRVIEHDVQASQYTSHSEEILEASRGRASALKSLSDDREVILTDDNKPNIAWVDNFDDYYGLLKLSFETLAQHGYWPRQDTDEVIEEIIEHEYEHYLPAQEQGLSIRCLVVFFENQNGMVGFRPELGLSGKTTVGGFREILCSTSKPSQHDTEGYF